MRVESSVCSCAPCSEAGNGTYVGTVYATDGTTAFSTEGYSEG